MPAMDHVTKTIDKSIEVNNAIDYKYKIYLKTKSQIQCTNN